jgi:Carboxypeptidase regulatory-like domain
MKQIERSFRASALILAFFGLLALCAGVAFGQAIDGNIVGTIVDSQGAAVVGADVTATNIATGVVATTKTGSTGEYRFDHLLVGTYRINAKMTGFKAVSEMVVVELNKTGTRNFTLTPGAASETIEVSGTPPTIDTTTSQLQTTYESAILQDLPTSGGSLGGGVLNASLLQAGVGSTGGLGAGSGPSIGGQRARENNFTIEGSDNNSKGVTGPLVYVPNDAVANFTVITNQFSPEFGHSAGGQFNLVVKSGTNTIHGMAYEYFRNRNLDAIDQKIANQGITKNPRYDNNRFGGQVGGPIIKDKLFYFVNFELNPVGQATSPSSARLAPTADGWTAILGIPGISANNANGFAQYATAPANDKGTVVVNDYVTTPGTPIPHAIPVGVVPIAAPNYINGKFLTTSFDWNISDKDQVRGRYVYNRYSQIDNTADLPVFYTTLLIPYHLTTLGEYHTFSPNIVNEFRVGYTRTSNSYPVPGFKFPGLDAFPNLTIDNLGGINVGPDQNAPQYATENTYQLVDNLSWNMGKHALKFGLDLRKQIDPQLFIQRSRGDYDWATLDGFVNDFVPDFGQRSFGAVGYSGDDKMIGWYVNDIWKITRNLSLNLGLRYEYLSVPVGWKQQSLNKVADAPGLITFNAPQAPKKDFMPRIGFAYSPGTSGNTSIRGGFAMAYDVLFDNIGTLSRPPQIGSTTNCPNAACQTPFLANGGIPPQASSGITILDPADARANTSAYLPEHVQYPYAESWNFGIQHVFGSYTAEVRYVGTRGVHLDTQNILNFVPGVNANAGSNIPTFITPPSAAEIAALTTALKTTQPASVCNKTSTPACPSSDGDLLGTLYYGYDDTGTGPGGFYDPRFLDAGFYSPITAFVPWGWSTYHGLQTQVQRRLTNGLQFQAAWTWSHEIDNSTADFFSTVISPRRPQDFRNLKAEKANGLLDHAHRVTFEVSYEVPWFAHDSNWMKKNLLGNYQFIPVFTWESGQWGTVQSGVDSNMNADSAPDRAIFNPKGVPGTGSGVTAITNDTACSLPPCIVGWVANNPNAQYIVAGQGSIATSSRGTLTTPPINNFDISAVKHFKFGERFEFDFLAQAFNLFNHPQFVTGSINDVLSLSNTTSRNNFLPSQKDFNTPSRNFSSNPRLMQLVLKFSF